MFQVQCLESKIQAERDLYSKYSIGPFVKGQSTTIGNALRRVLLSNLSGVAITGVRITGINHEFSTISNVKEDVVDILLNLKQIVLKGSITEPTLARLYVTKPGIITASDIDLPAGLSFVNSRQYIASLTDDGNVEMEFLIDKGQNYISSSKIDSVIPAGFLSVDAVFMPVKQVNFFVETSRNRVASELENLILEIATDGSINTDEALTSAAQILENTFTLLKITNTIPNLPVNLDTPLEEKKGEHLETIFIEELELSVRAYNCLKRANVHTLSDLLQYSPEELLEFKNFGQKSADEVCESLEKKFQLKLRT
jgi:DNA-directed RNA polymerase subunit alpha